MSASNESPRRDSSGGRNRHRSRNRNRNRNRTRDGSQEGNRAEANRGRNRNRPRRPRVVMREPNLFERILEFVTFGLWKPKLHVTPTAESRSPAVAERQPLKERDESRPGQPSAPRTRRERNPEEADRDRPAREKRPPEASEVTTPRLYVGNLDYETTEADLYDLFNGVGKVKDAEVVCHKYTQRSKGYAFVVMSTVEEAKRAVAVLNNKAFMGRELWVSGAKSTGPKDLEEGAGEEESADRSPTPAQEEPAVASTTPEEISGREAVA